MNTPVSQNYKDKNQGNDEIDVLEIAKIFWNGRKVIVKTMLITGLLGILIALLSPKEYTATTSMVPQTAPANNKLGGLSSLAAIAGFNLDLNSTSDNLTPLVYPQIVKSTPYQLELMNMPFSFAKVDHPISLYEYYTEVASPEILSLISKYTIGLPGLLISSFKKNTPEQSSEGKGPIALSMKQDRVRRIIEQKVVLDLDSKQGFLTLTATFSEALVSAQVADQARELLQKYITQFKTGKAIDQLNFIEQRFLEKKIEFEKAQEHLARFRDQNKNVSSALAKTEEERLQSEYNIAMDVYNELAKQLEQAKIQVKQETPVFSILEPAMIPQEKSKPKRTMIVLLWIFLGGFIGTIIVFGKILFNKVNSRWNEIG